MAVKVTIAKKLEVALRGLLDSGPVMEKHGTTIRQLVASIDDAHSKHEAKVEAKRYGGVDAKEVVRTIKSVLGGKAYAPANPGQAFYAFVAKRCQFLGVSLGDIEKAAVQVRTGSKHVKLPTSVEWFIRKLDAVLEELAGDTEVDVGTVNSEGDTEWQINIGR